MEYYIGTSGWGYKEWEGSFYPAEYKNNKLIFYAQHFNAVEVNNSFYRLPSKRNIEQWQRQAPKGFHFTVKASRYITHTKKLKAVDEALQQFYQSIAPFDKNCYVILFQFPPSFSKDCQRLESFLKQLSKDYRYTFEFRNATWHSDDTYELLEKHKMAFCIFDIAEMHSPFISTTDFLYIRLHGHEGKYQGKYTADELAQWYRKIKEANKTTYVFFDNTAVKIDAIENAYQLTKLLSEGG